MNRELAEKRDLANELQQEIAKYELEQNRMLNNIYFNEEYLKLEQKKQKAQARIEHLFREAQEYDETFNIDIE